MFTCLLSMLSAVISVRDIIFFSAMHFIYFINGHESRFNLFGLLTNNTQRICLVASGGRKHAVTFRSLVRRFAAAPHMST